MNAAPAPDEWDRWNYDRTAQLVEAPRSAQYVPAEIAGVDDLDRYGDWREQPRYGHVWVPRDVGADWAPYSTGRWVYDPFYEWTWVDNSPWGWAPYHYGRWVNFNGVWGWAPGPVVAAPVYSPALVAFFGAPGIGVSVGVGLPFVSWCALGFGEPIVPWWGRPGFVGRPYWGGWGGPRVVNNVVINNTRIVNVRNITRYQNVHVRNAVMGVDRNQFGRGRMEHIRLDAQRVQRLQPLHGDLRVRPVAASLVPREARGQRPPDRLRTRQVVTTRPPQDPMSRLRAKGIEAKAPEVRPAPRVVQPQHGPGVPNARPRAGNGAGHPATAGEQPPPESGRSHPGGVQAGQPARPGPPARAERPQPGAPGASERAMPEQHSHPQAPPPHERAAPPPPSSQHQAAPPERAAPQHSHPQAPPPHERAAPPPPPSQQQAAPPERAAPQPSHPQAPPPHERAAQPPPPSRQQAAPPERAAPQHSHPQAPPPHERAAQPPPASRQQAAPPERAAPQHSHPQAPPPHERAAQPQQPSHPQAPPPEQAAPRHSHPQAPPPHERAAQPQQPSHPQAPPPEQAAPRQPRSKRPAPDAAGEGR